MADGKQLLSAVPALLVYWLVCMFVLKSFCPVVAFTGFPCPGCGCIRAMKLCLTGHFVKAWQMNPCFFLWAVFAVYLFIWRYIIGQKPKGGRTILIVICCFMLLFYLIRMVLYFPGRAPYLFQEDNILNHWIYGYSDRIVSLIN